MKRKTVIFLTLFVVLLIAFWWLLNHKTVEGVSTAETNQSNNISETLTTSKLPLTDSGPEETTTTSTPPYKVTAMREQMQKSREQAIESANDEWRAPIDFYGKVVDQDNKPVSEATIVLSWNNLSGTQNSKTQSDSWGGFSLRGEQGKFLSVIVNKEGYYAYKPQGEGFFYAGRNENFIPDASSPVEFRLHRKGKAEPITVFARNIQLSISGKPLELDLKTGQAVPAGKGDLIVEFFRTPLDQAKRQAFDWRLKITPRNGGIVLSTREFDFLAPESGYQSLELIDMPLSLGEKWQGRMNRQYFLKLADGNYARVHFDLRPSNGSLRIESFLNASGSRNLEYDEAIQPKPTVHE